MRELPFYTNWSYAHPRAIELAAEVASLAPGDLNRVFFVLRRLRGGRVGVEARAPVLPRRAASKRRAPRVRSARPSGTTSIVGGTAAAHATRRSRATSPTTARRWARSRSTASRRSATPFEPLVPEVRHVSNTNRYHRPPDETEEEFTRVPARRARAGDPRDGARDGLPRAHGAGPERRRLRSRRRRATGTACARSATATTSCSRPTR